MHRSLAEPAVPGDDGQVDPRLADALGDDASVFAVYGEVRVFVRPQQVDDLTAIRLARDIATKIESSMQYPGTIKVNVIRETRAIEYAK